jgi:hypothetical protein
MLRLRQISDAGHTAWHDGLQIGGGKDGFSRNPVPPQEMLQSGRLNSRLQRKM